MEVAGTLGAAPKWNNRLNKLLKTRRIEKVQIGQVDSAAIQDGLQELTCDWLSVQSAERIELFTQERHRGLTLTNVEEFWGQWSLQQFWVYSQSGGIANGVSSSCLQWARHLLDTQSTLSRQQQLARVMENCCARVGPRSLLAHLPPDCALWESPEVRLLCNACFLSLHPDADRLQYDSSLQECTGHGGRIFTDLAQYLLGEADPAAMHRLRAPLLAYSAEIGDPLLHWGLRYIVGGHVRFPDGSECSVDELLNDASLSFLDELPPLIELHGG